MRVLLFNASSSSLKFSVLESSDLSVTASGMADWAGDGTRYQFSAFVHAQLADRWGILFLPALTTIPRDGTT